MNMVRIYLSGRLTLETDAGMCGPSDFASGQARAAFAYLVGHRGQPVARAALADALWPREPPAAWSSALNSLVSKLRTTLGRAGLDGAASLTTTDGCHELRLPSDSWVDHEAAAAAIHEAETALASGESSAAYGPSAVAHHISRRPFLPAEEGTWFAERRSRMAGILLRALECRAAVYLANGELTLAVEAAREATAVSPYRESAYRLLMRAHAAAGNAAEALWEYERLRTLMTESLGVGPSRETRDVHAELLAAR